ncbi:MAG: tetratricopeptide repeat protein [Rhodospirillaceae bacterium]|nr:tetratricopeptide repeat protein [Rhodospirillaceae bacterium]
MTLARSKALVVGLVSAVAITFYANTAWSIAGVDFPSHSVAEAQAAIDSGDFETAVTMLEEILRFEPENPEVSNLLGYSKRNLGELDVAMEYYNKALSFDPNHMGTLEYQGELYLMLKDQASAVKNLDKLKELCPTGCVAYDVLQAAIERSKDGGEFTWSKKTMSTQAAASGE